jgi:hypothetical protein
MVRAARFLQKVIFISGNLWKGSKLDGVKSGGPMGENMRVRW